MKYNNVSGQIFLALVFERFGFIYIKKLSMEQVNDAKELIINLQDLDSKISGLSKELLALFVEVDNELVDVLVYAVREHFAVIPYWENRNIKLTLRNIMKHEAVGSATQKMSLFKSFEGSLEQTLYLDGRDKFRLHEEMQSSSIPNAKIVYEWRDPDPDPETDFYDEVKYTLEQYKGSHMETEEKIRQIEIIFAQLARSSVKQSLIRKFHVNDFKKVTENRFELAQNNYAKLEEFEKEGEVLSKDSDAINAKVDALEEQLRALELSITTEQQNERTIHEEMSSYSIIKPNKTFESDKEQRSKKKEEISTAVFEISEKTLVNVKKIKEENLSWGLEQTLSKRAQFDDIVSTQEKVRDKKLDLEGIYAEIRNADAELAAKVYEIDSLEVQSKELNDKERDLDARIIETDESLQAMLEDKKDASDRGDELATKVAEYEAILKDLEEESLRIKSEAESAEITEGQYKSSGGSNPELVQLQNELGEAEAGRDEAQAKLESMEGAWVECIEEVSAHAERLSGDKDDEKYRKETQKLIKDINDASNISADLYKVLETTDQNLNAMKIVDESKLANELHADIKKRNARLEQEDKIVVDSINDGIGSIETKIQIVEEEQGKIPPLTTKLEELLKERDELQILYEELLSQKETRERDHEDGDLRYQRELEEYERRIEEMNTEITQLKSQVKVTTKTIYNIKPQVEEMKGELETWFEKIKIKKEIMRKRKMDDELDAEYIPFPGDRADELIARYKANKITEIPIKRIEEGHYMFATMRVEVTESKKRRSGFEVKMIRTGKKYDLEDFIRNVANKEIEKLDKMNEFQEIVVDESEKTEIRRSPNSRGGSPSRSSGVTTEVVTTSKISNYRR